MVCLLKKGNSLRTFCHTVSAQKLHDCLGVWGGAKRDWCYALVDGGARPTLTAFREG